MTSTAVEQRQYTPTQFVETFADSFTASLPSHINPGQWLAVALDAVRRDPKIAQAAANDMRAFSGALRQAARRGLEPGTEQFYLVPFAPYKGAPQVIQGIVGYQGLVELMYRAGAVQSVKVEIVKEHDQFTYRPADQFPDHVVNWFGDRGATIGVYAYAVMEGGATSKVIVLGLDDLARYRARSASAKSSHSPWTTDFDAMAMKTATRQLAKWVPTSAEYRREKLRSAQAVMDERTGKPTMTVAFPDAEQTPVESGQHIDPLTGEIEMDDPIDAELVEEPEDAVGPDPKA